MKLFCYSRLRDELLLRVWAPASSQAGQQMLSDVWYKVRDTGGGLQVPQIWAPVQEQLRR